MVASTQNGLGPSVFAAINLRKGTNMMFSKQQVERLRKACATAMEANRTVTRTSLGRDGEVTRPWSRTVSGLGNKTLENAFQAELEKLCPVATCEFDIDVWSTPGTTEVRVQIKNHRRDLDFMCVANAEDFGEDVPAAMLKILTDLIEDFKKET